MEKKKPTLVTLTDSEKQKARELSLSIFGRVNISMLFAYLITEKAKQQSDKNGTV